MSYERAYNLVVIRVSVTSQVLGSTSHQGRLQEFKAPGRNVKWGPKIYKNNISNITNILFHTIM